MEKENADTRQEFLSFQNADLGYSGKAVISAVELTLYKGRFYGIVGPNGAGKTTMIKSMLGIIKPLSGRIVRSSEFRFGYVPQRESMDELFPLSVWDIVMMSRYPLLKAFKIPGKIDRDAVRKSIHDVGLDHLKNTPYRQLSGGQKQRTLIARALAGEPDVLVLDEPTNGMDIGAEKAIMDVIKGLHRQGFTIVMITHLINLVADCADYIMLLNGGISFGLREEILTSKSLSETYDIEVTVCNERGRTLIFA